MHRFIEIYYPPVTHYKCEESFISSLLNTTKSFPSDVENLRMMNCGDLCRVSQEWGVIVKFSFTELREHSHYNYLLPAVYSG